jgi:branched-chain amino acid aminotransferase
VMDLAERELHLQIVERAIDRSELYICDELFFTGTAVGVMPIVKVDHRPVRNAAIGTITSRIRQLYFDAARGHISAYRRWLVPVYESQKARLREVDVPELTIAR